MQHQTHSMSENHSTSLASRPCLMAPQTGRTPTAAASPRARVGWRTGLAPGDDVHERRLARAGRADQRGQHARPERAAARAQQLQHRAALHRDRARRVLQLLPPGTRGLGIRLGLGLVQVSGTSTDQPTLMCSAHATACKHLPDSIAPWTHEERVSFNRARQPWYYNQSSKRTLCEGSRRALGSGT